MNFKTISFILGVGILGFASCDSDSDFLKETPKSVLTIDNAYNSSEQILATVLTAYNKYENFFFPGEWGGGPLGYKSAGTDMWDGNNQEPHYSNFTTYWSADAGFVKTVWDTYYEVIASCNLALRQMDQVKWSDESLKARLTAECHFLRGASYLRLAEYYGGVPLVKEYSDQPRYDYTRATRTETYQFAIDELVAAHQDLPEKVGSTEYGRAGRGAAALYLSEAFLALGVEDNNDTYYDSKTCYNNAETFAQEVIRLHPMMTQRFGVRTADATGARNGIANRQPNGNVFSDLFVSDNVVSPNNTEAVWVMPSSQNYATYSKNGGYRENALNFSPAVQDMNWDPKYKESGAGDGPWKVVSPKYGGKINPAIHGAYTWALLPITWFASYELWDKAHDLGTDDRYKEGVTVRTKYLVTDPKHSRYETYMGWEAINKADENTCSKFVPIFYKETPLDKWDYDQNDPGFFGNICFNYRNKYGARSSEAYLLLAEAYYRNGNPDAALHALNAVRQRANAPAMTTIDMQVILDERARELMFEEDRWATLLRMKPEEWKQRITKYGMYSARGGDKVFPQERRWSEYTGDIKFNLWPIPQTYIDQNKNAEMPQNEGWK